MSFHLNDQQQMTMHDSYLNQTPRTQKMIQNSWCKDFADIVFPAINEERFSVLYSRNSASRPNTPVNIIIGALMLKEIIGLSDDELLESICCDVRYQYALHTTHMEEQPFSDRTFSRFRERLYNYEVETGTDLLEEEMRHLAEVYADCMKLHTNLKRMDSLMIASRCKRMSRLEIIYTANANAIKLIHRLGHDELITEELQHYMDDDDYNQVIYYCKGEDVTPRLTKVIQEAEQIKKIMEDDCWHEFSEYQLLIRVLTEQSDVDENGNVIPKDKADITSDSLQNPSDPDATYRSKAGKSNKGYVGNIVEAIGEDGDSLITEVAYEQNIHSDSDFCKEYLENRPDDAEKETMICDGAYSGKENQELAESKNVELVPTALSGKEIDPVFAEFVLSEDGTEVLKCPQGHAPVKTTHYPKTGMNRALFPIHCCENCPHKDQCKAKQQRKNYAVHVSANMVDRAKYQQKLSTEEHKKLTRQRNAVEGIMSVLRRKYHVDAIPVFGRIRSKVFFLFKICAYNFNKLRSHNRRLRERSAQNLAFET